MVFIKWSKLTYPSSPYSCVKKSLSDIFIVNDKNLVKSLNVRVKYLSLSDKCDHLALMTVIQIPVICVFESNIMKI
jgi:hypothetical protein